MEELPLDIQKLIFAKCDCDTKVNLIKAGVSPDLVIGKVKMPSREAIAKIRLALMAEVMFLKYHAKINLRMKVLNFSTSYPNFINQYIYEPELS